ncbi:hypothetical protein OROMI_014389 [Orobanche minor]
MKPPPGHSHFDMFDVEGWNRERASVKKNEFAARVTRYGYGPTGLAQKEDSFF